MAYENLFDPHLLYLAQTDPAAAAEYAASLGIVFTEADAAALAQSTQQSGQPSQSAQPIQDAQSAQPGQFDPAMLKALEEGLFLGFLMDEAGRAELNRNQPGGPGFPGVQAQGQQFLRQAQIATRARNIAQQAAAQSSLLPTEQQQTLDQPTEPEVPTLPWPGFPGPPPGQGTTTTQTQPNLDEVETPNIPRLPLPPLPIPPVGPPDPTTPPPPPGPLNEIPVPVDRLPDGSVGPPGPTTTSTTQKEEIPQFIPPLAAAPTLWEKFTNALNSPAASNIGNVLSAVAPATLGGYIPPSPVGVQRSQYTPSTGLGDILAALAAQQPQQYGALGPAFGPLRY